MRIFVMTIVAVISYILQSTVLGYVEIYNIKPNLIIITTISYALIRGKEEGAIYGLFAGLLMDIMGGKIIGAYALMGMYLGLAVGSLNKDIYKENYLIPFMLTAGGTFVYNLIFYIFSYFLFIQEQLLWYVVAYIIPETIYNTVLSVIIYFLILYINKKLDYRKKTSKAY